MTTRLSIHAVLLAIIGTFALPSIASTTRDTLWSYACNVHYFGPDGVSPKIELTTGTVIAKDEASARRAAEREARGRYSRVLTSSLLYCIPVNSSGGSSGGLKARSPNDAKRGVNQNGAGRNGGHPRRLVIPGDVEIRGVRVFADRRVDGFHFLGDDENWYGFKGSGSPAPKFINFDGDERLTGFRGVHGKQWDRVWIITNKREYGPFGGGGGSKEFTITVPKGHKIIGMHGRTGKVIDRAGLVTETK